MTSPIISAAPDQYQAMLASYASILEKTNQQLSLWWNPYGAMIGILTLIVAVGAIVVSIMLVHNSREQKSRQKDFFDELNARNEKIRQNYQHLIEEHEKELKNAADNTIEKKKELQGIEFMNEKFKKICASCGLSIVLGTAYVCSVSGKRCEPLYKIADEPTRIIILDSSMSDRYALSGPTGSPSVISVPAQRGGF